MTLHRLLSGLMPVVLGLLLVCQAGSVMAQETSRAQAQTALDEGRYAEAISILTRVLDRDAQDADALMLRGQAFEARRQFDDAIRDYERALRIRPGDPMAETGLNRARRGADTRTTAALDLVRRQVEANPDNLSFRLQYADGLREAGQLAEAAEQYRFYLSRTQGTPDVVTNYLVVLAGLGNHQLGATETGRYLNLYPSSSDLWMRLGYFRMWAGQFSQSEEAFERALALNPQHAEARQGLEQLAVSREQARTSVSPAFARIEQFERQLSQNPNQPDTRFRLVDALISLGRHVEAFGHLQVLAPDFADTERWSERFRRVDRSMPEGADVYRIDRLRYRLAENPADMEVRYALVNALRDEQRYSDAYNTLLAGGAHVPQGDTQYQQRLQQLQQERVRHARERRDELTAQLASNPADLVAARELASHYPILYANGDMGEDRGEAAALYERLLASRPNDPEVRLSYVEFLRQTGNSAQAMQQLDRLIQTDPDDPRYIMQYLYAAVEQTPVPAQAHRMAERGLEIAPNDPEMLLAAVTFYISATTDEVNYLDRADQLLERARAAGADAREVAARAQAIRAAREYRPLADARRAAREGRYITAIEGIEAYYADTAMPRDVRLELAQYYYESGDTEGAIEYLRQAQQERFTADVQLVMARIYFDAGRYQHALTAAQPIVEREPHNVQGLLLYGDALRETNRHSQARQVYRQAAQIAGPADRTHVDERLAFIETHGPGTGLGVLLAPRTDIIWAGGDGIEYQRFAPGFDAQLALPTEPLVTLIAGYQGHRIAGTDLIIPALAQPVSPYVAHELGGGAIIDLTPQVNTPLGIENYTNRVHVEAGVFSYTDFGNRITGQPDRRTAPYWMARYLHHTPTEYTFSVGLSQTEGAIELWAPIGPSINLRLLQADVRGSAAPFDSLLKVSGRLALNRVTHDRARFSFGVPIGFTGEQVVNNGYSVDLKGGYRLVRNLYAGLNYHRLQYDHSSPFFFAPSDRPYQLVEAFLEYERFGGPGQPYFRVLGAVGTVTGGFLTQRVEADLIYPLVSNLALGVNLRAGQSGRSFTDGTFSSYNIFVFSAALFIGL